ncbi:MAG: DUF3078 domain-containing protein [Muribaculaceae bacterium]|nr:DUF3078 domain-containing protein [Muribaculaceae bacterium]
MKRISLIVYLAIAALAGTSQPVAANDGNGGQVEPDMLYAPLVFENHFPDAGHAAMNPANPKGLYSLDAGDEWLQQAIDNRMRTRRTRQRAMIDRPQLVAYNAHRLPEAPPEGIIEGDPRQAMLTVVTPQVVVPEEATPADAPDLKIHDWLHVFNASLQFTQAYISGNWYQGGENNLALLGSINWNCNLNQDRHPNWLFNNALSYKLGLATTHGDSIRNYLINEDNFLFTSQLGYKAVKNWYYSAMLQFTTQFLNNYKTNTRTMTAAFLSPAELNVGLGMTYNYKKADDRMFTLAIAPISYNLKYCRNITDIDPTRFGIDAGKHCKSTVGSNFEAKLLWRFNPSVMISSRLYMFTNYEYVQGDWENTLDFNIGKYLTTQFYTHLRFDRSHPRDNDWNYWQFKEILSLGIIYRFATVN